YISTSLFINHYSVHLSPSFPYTTLFRSSGFEAQAIFGGQALQRKHQAIEHARIEAARVHGNGLALVFYKRVCGGVFGQPIGQARANLRQRRSRRLTLDLARACRPAFGPVLAVHNEMIESGVILE